MIHALFVTFLLLLLEGKIVNKDYCDPVIYKEACTDKSSRLDFNRQNKNNDIHKHISLKIYATNGETSLISTMLLFYTNTNEYHNAFMIGANQFEKYKRITGESKLRYNNEITILAKSIKHDVPYSIITTSDRVGVYDPDHNNYLQNAYTSYLPLTTDSGDITTLTTINTPQWDPFMYYDALLSLDRYSSIWDHYNILRVEKHTISLRYNENAQLQDDRDDFDGIVKIHCGLPSQSDIIQHKIQSKVCLVRNVLPHGNVSSSSSGLIVNGVYYPHYKLVIDLSLRVNSIPTDLYLAWKENSLMDIAIGLQSFNTTTTTNALSSSYSFILTSKFEFEMNEHNVIIIGVDLLHHFPLIEYSVDNNQFNVWYHTHIYYTHQYEWLQILSIFLLLTLLVCFFFWIMDINYLVFGQLLNYDALVTLKLKGMVYFSFRQIVFEILSIAVTILLWIFGSIYILDNKTGQPPMFQFASSFYRQIFGLFLLLSISHTFILALIITLTNQMNRKMINYQLARLDRFFTSSAYGTRRSILIGPVQSTTITHHNSDDDDDDDDEKRVITYGASQLFLFGDNGENETMEKKKKKKKKSKNRVKEDSKDRVNRRRKEQDDAEKQERSFYESYHLLVTPSPYPLVLIRNLTFVVITLSSTICILLFDNNNVYRLYMVIISYLMTYFMAYYILLLFIYLTSKTARAKKDSIYILYILFLIVEIAIFIAFVLWSVNSIHLNYFEHINSIYSTVLIYCFVITMVSMIILFAFATIKFEIDRHLLTRYHIS